MNLSIKKKIYKNKMTSINALKIFFSISLIIIAGCSMIGNANRRVWPIPEKPYMKPVEIVPFEEPINTNSYCLSSEHAINLSDNVAELKAYVKKLEILISAITEYYGDKTKEYKKLEK